MLAFFGMGPTELVIIAGIGLLMVVVVVSVVMAANKSSVAGPPHDSSQLTTCSACGRSISRAAAACPQCGHPNPPQPPIRG